MLEGQEATTAALLACLLVCLFVCLTQCISSHPRAYLQLSRASCSMPWLTVLLLLQLYRLTLKH